MPRYFTKYFRLSLTMLLVVGSVLLFASSGFATIKMTPYLQAVTTNSIYVLVECDSTSTVTVDYGTTTAYGSSATTESTVATSGSSPATYIHNIKLTGLQPKTTYHYKVTQGSSSSSDSSFTTAVNPGTNFRFAWMADFRTGTSVHDGIATRVQNANPAFSLYGGDLCTDSTYNAFKSEFFRTNELALISKVPFFACVGNHETWSPNTKAFEQAPDSSSGTQEYYSFDYGDIHFVCINNETTYSSGSAQYNWVRDDLAATKKTWKIVFYHQPAYCAGGHGENADMKTMSVNLFVPNKVDLVLNGHSHLFEDNVVSGLHHMVIGSVGAPLDTPGSASYVTKSASSYCYGIIDVTPTTLHLVVYNSSGSVLDTVDLTKAAAPSAPTGLTASVVSSSQVNLAWTDTSSDESGFKIERSTDGTNFTQIATTGTGVTTYSNTGLSANTTYYYRVKAYNTTGDSTDSNVANASTTVYQPATTLGSAKTMSDGTNVDISGSTVITLTPASEPNVFYVQDIDGNAGIRVETAGSRPAVGTTGTIKGQLTTKSNGERALVSASFAQTGSGVDAQPRGLNNRDIGGFGYVGSETSGISSQGLLVTVWGNVSKTANDQALGPVFWLDDGSAVDSGETDGTTGIKVIESDLTPNVGQFYSVVGVISSEMISGKMIRVIRFSRLIP